MKQLLFVSTPSEDYLSDSVLVGLKQLLGPQVVDYPKRESIYSSFGADRLTQIYGHGFSLYGTIPDEPVDRTDIEGRLSGGEFSAVVVGELWWNWQWILRHEESLSEVPTVLLDGMDSMRLFPNLMRLRLKPAGWFLSRLDKRFPVLKRELSVVESHAGMFTPILPRWMSRRLSKMGIPRGVHPTSFSIPEQKIVDELPHKTKDFPVHVVDRELQRLLPDARSSYAFENESEYYADLRTSRFGITTKRSGWDCMRHYEIAANGTVICFRDLDRKPSTCAPHGLVDGENCISYSNAQELLGRVESLDEVSYRRMQEGSFRWAKTNTCRRRAQELLVTHLSKESDVAERLRPAHRRKPYKSVISMTEKQLT